MIEITAITLLGLLQVKHFLADYVLQNSYILENRRRILHPAGYIHAFIHVALTAGLLMFFTGDVKLISMIAAGEFVFHVLVDLAKDNWLHSRKLNSSNAEFWWVQGLDQLLHQISYILIAALL